MPESPIRLDELDETDVRIVKALVEAGKALRPREIAERIGEDGRRVAAKMRKLVRLGLVKRVGDGVYEATEKAKEIASAHAEATA